MDKPKSCRKNFWFMLYFTMFWKLEKNSSVAYKPVQIHFSCSFICFTTKARAETINLSIQPWSLRGCVNGTIKKALKANIWQAVKISPFLKLNGLASSRMGDEGTMERLLHYSCNDKPDGFKSQRLHTRVSHYSKRITVGPAKCNLSCPRHWDMFPCTINLGVKYLTAHSTFCLKKSHGGTVLKWHLQKKHNVIFGMHRESQIPNHMWKTFSFRKVGTNRPITCVYKINCSS